MNRSIVLTIACVAGLCSATSMAQNTARQTREEMLRQNEATAAALAAPLIAADKTHPRVGGYWEPEKTMAAFKTVDGKQPPLTAAGRSLQQQRAAQIRRGDSEDPMQLCLPPGTPRDMLSPGPFMIVQTPAKVTMLHQFRHLIRHVYLDGPLKFEEEPDPWWEGHFSGRWEGDVLIIETAGFNGNQWLDETGLPQSENMKVVERFRLTGPDTLEDEITIEDPEFYSKPWSTRLTYRRLPGEGRHLVQEECNEQLLEFPLREYAPAR